MPLFVLKAKQVEVVPATSLEISLVIIFVYYMLFIPLSTIVFRNRGESPYGFEIS